MIKLTRATTPPQLDSATVTTLTTEFVVSNESVWNTDYIKNSLLKSSNNKCAYCETKVDVESKYMEVEHFRCKNDFPNLVVEWDNLLPSCKHCNGQKGKHNVETDGMIVNPYVSDPRNHLYFQNYRLRWRDDDGRRTVETLYLNDSPRLVSVRLQVGEAIAKALEHIRDLLEGYLQGQNSTVRKNRITRGMRTLLNEAQPQAEYSALAATILLNDPDYIWIKNELSILQLWDDMTALEASASAISL